MQVSCFAVLFQFIVIKIVTAYSIAPMRIPPSQLYPAPEQRDNQQLLRTLLSPTYNKAQFPERLEILTEAIQQMPPKKNKIYLADLFKQSALQSLTVAANVCKRTGALPAELQSQSGMRQIEVSVGQPGIRRQIELPTLGKTGLPGQNISPLPVGNIPKEILGNILADYVPRKTVRIRYY